VNVVGAKIEGFAARPRNITQRQQHLGRGEIFTGSPEHPRAAGQIRDEALGKRGLSGTGFRGDGHDPTPALAGIRECVAQAAQLFIPL